MSLTGRIWVSPEGAPGSRAVRNIWMLEELGLPYENVPTHFANGDTKKPEYLALNPNGRIPTLVDDGEAFWESMAINFYLARSTTKASSRSPSRTNATPSSGVSGP